MSAFLYPVHREHSSYSNFSLCGEPKQVTPHSKNWECGKGKTTAAHLTTSTHMFPTAVVSPIPVPRSSRAIYPFFSPARGKVARLCCCCCWMPVWAESQCCCRSRCRCRRRGCCCCCGCCYCCRHLRRCYLHYPLRPRNDVAQHCCCPRRSYPALLLQPPTTASTGYHAVRFYDLASLVGLGWRSWLDRTRSITLPCRPSDRGRRSDHTLNSIPGE